MLRILIYADDDYIRPIEWIITTSSNNNTKEFKRYIDRCRKLTWLLDPRWRFKTAQISLAKSVYIANNSNAAKPFSMDRQRTADRIVCLLPCWPAKGSLQVDGYQCPPRECGDSEGRSGVVWPVIVLSIARDNGWWMILFFSCPLRKRRPPPLANNIPRGSTIPNRPLLIWWNWAVRGSWKWRE